MIHTQLKQDWEELGTLDPLWAVVTSPGRQFGGWDTDAFFATGAREVDAVMQTAERLGYPRAHERALDFGCGVGRLTRVLARHFDQCYGIDISESMVTKARELNSDVANCHFMVSDGQDLSVFQDRYFDMVYTFLVLMHLPSEALIEHYITELVRVLRPSGLLVFQVLTDLSLRRKLQLGRRLYGVLRKCGVSERLLYEQLHLSPISVRHIAERKVLDLLDRLNVNVMETKIFAPAGLLESRTFFVTR
jgi:ubiquinone/menaquinone biosynthesis C-methylase UbiE